MNMRMMKAQCHCEGATEDACPPTAGSNPSSVILSLLSVILNIPSVILRRKPKNLSPIIVFIVLSFILYPLSFVIAKDQPAKFQASGPLNIRNQMPLYLFYIAPTPQAAKALDKGKVKADASYHVSNVIIQQRPWPAQQFTPTDGAVDGQKNREWYVYIDTEVNRFDLNLAYGILDNLEASVDIPYFVFSGGYFDGFIENFEDAFSAIKTPNAREERPRDKYEYEFRNRAKPIINDKSEPDGLGEITAYLKYQFLKEDKWWPTLSLRGGVKFPTATNKLLGSDKFDYALSLLLDKNIFDRLSLYCNVSYVIIERPDMMSNLYGFKDNMLHGMIGAEYFLTNKTSLLFQATASTSVYDYSGMSPNGGVTSICRDPVVLTLGFNHNFSDKISWQIAMDENTNTAAPDFGLFTSLKIKL